MNTVLNHIIKKNQVKEDCDIQFSKIIFVVEHIKQSVSANRFV